MPIPDSSIIVQTAPSVIVAALNHRHTNLESGLGMAEREGEVQSRLFECFGHHKSPE